MVILEEGIPVVTPAAPVAGSTAPATLAGTLVQLNAEVLAGVAVVQTLKPGHPMLYGAVPTSSDMRTMAFCFGSVEMGLMNAAAAELARFYSIPLYATAGVTESKVPDAQAGYEKATTLALAALAGCDYIHDAVGLIDSGMTISLASYVIDDEICGMALRAIEGINVSDESLAVEVIARVGPGGHFLAEDHTVEHMRNEFFFPRVSDRSNREAWEAGGYTTGAERAGSLARQILSSHRVAPLPEAAKRAIESWPEIGGDEHAIGSGED